MLAASDLIKSPPAKPAPTVRLPVTAEIATAEELALSFCVDEFESSADIYPPPIVTEVSPAVVTY